MKIADRQDIMTFLIHLLVWIPMMVVPAVISYFIVPTTGMASLLLSRALVMLGPMFVIYMITYYLNVPYLLFRGKKLWFAIASVALIVGVNIHLFFADMSMMPSIVQMGFYAWLATSISTNILVILAAIGIRSFVRSHKKQIELQEKLRKTAEAELVWLKNQLNPHFLAQQHLFAHPDRPRPSAGCHRTALRPSALCSVREQQARGATVGRSGVYAQLYLADALALFEHYDSRRRLPHRSQLTSDSAVALCLVHRECL